MIKNMMRQVGLVSAQCIADIFIQTSPGIYGIVYSYLMNDLSPGVREAVDALINQECGRFAPRNYLEYLGPEVELQLEVKICRILCC